MDQLEHLDAEIARPKQLDLGQQVLEQLRMLIVLQKLPRGLHLVESSLSQTFDVSRGPIRTALAQLEAEGLVETRKRGTFVSGLSSSDIEELYQVREAIEATALAIATDADDADWAPLERALELLQQHCQSGDHLAYAAADMDFHSSIYEVAGNTRLRHVWKQYEPTFRILLQLTNAQDSELSDSLESHRRLVELAKTRETQQALLELRDHLRGSKERLIAAFDQEDQTANLSQ